MNTSQIIVLLFGILYFAFLLRTRRKGDFEDFSVAGRSVGLFLIFASICATYIGPAMTMGLTRDGFTDGLFLTYIATAGGFAMMAVAFFFAPKVRAKFEHSYSIGDVIAGAKTHNHRAVKIAVGLISAWLMASITIAMSYAGGEIVNNAFGFSKSWSIVIITLIVITYSFFGGIRASIQTDAIQFSLFVVLIPLLAILLVADHAFSWSDFQAHAFAATERKFEAETLTSMFGLLLFWILHTAGLDAPIVNRFLAAKNIRVTRNATALAGLFFVFWIVLMVFIGSAGAYLHPDFPNDDQVLLKIAAVYFPDFLYGIFLIALIGVVMSTQDSAINMAAIAFSEDVMGGFQPHLSNRQKLRYAKIFMVAVGVLAIFVAGFFTSILQVIIVIFSFYIPVMIPVTLFAVLKKGAYHWQAAIAAMSVGLITNFAWSTFGNDILPTVFVGMLASALAYWIVDRFID